MRWFGNRLCLSGLAPSHQTPVASLRYSAFLLSRLYVSVAFGPTCSIIFAASVNAIFFSSCFPVCVSEHYSTACTRRVYPLIMVAIWTCAPFVTSVAVNVCVPACVAPCLRSLWVCTRDWDGRSHSSSVLTLRISKLGSTAAEPFCTPTVNVQTSVSPRPHQCWSYFLKMTSWWLLRWHLIVVQPCISLMNNDAEHLFMCLWAILYLLWRNVC